MPIRRVRVQVRRILRKIFHHDDPAPRIARGVAAGFFVAAFPLPGLQIPLSLLVAALARGNKAVAVLPQFLANSVTMLPMLYLELWIGLFIWPSTEAGSTKPLMVLREATERWSWSSPFSSTSEFFQALGSLGFDVLGALLIGIVLLGACLAALSYPATIFAVWLWRKRRLDQGRAKGIGFRLPPPFVIRESSEREAALLTQDAVIARYALHPDNFHEASLAKLLVDGRQAYPAMLEAIGAAKTKVDLETYILQADRTGLRFQEALVKAAARGVKIRLLYDAVGSLSLSQDYVDPLLAMGVEIGVYHPLLFPRPSWALNRRDHRKILLADERVSFTGGINISDHYSPKEDEGHGWRDTHVHLEGRSVASELQALFDYAWHKAQYLKPGQPKRRPVMDIVRSFLPPRRSERLKPAGVVKGVAVEVISNREFRMRRRIRAAYLHAIRRAQRYILIETGFFLPDRGIRRALRNAVKRGVVVAVGVSRVTDPKISAWAGRALYSELLPAGVRIFEWPDEMLHAKTAVIDDAWSVVGSYNINSRSLFHDLEMVAVIANVEFAQVLRKQTLDDLARSKEITLQEHETRSWKRMLLESLAYSLRYWL